MKVNDSFGRALEDSDTYEDPRIIQVVSSKTEVFRNSLLTGKEKTVNKSQTYQNMDRVRFQRDLLTGKSLIP
jgi:hypothetical protein